MSIKFGAKEVCDVTVFDLSTGKPFLYLDTLKMTSLEVKATTSYARGGKGNPKLLGWDFDKEATVKMQDALLSTRSLSLLTGNATVTGIANVYKREVLVAVIGATGKSKVTATKTPIAGTVTAFLVGAETVEVVSTLAVSDISFADTDIPVGSSAIIYYQYATLATAEKIVISSDKFPAYVKIVGDTVVRNVVTGADEAFQMIIWKAKIQPNFTLDFKSDGDPSVFAMDLDVFRRDIDTEMVELIKY